jgi:predicted secreted protein
MTLAHGSTSLLKINDGSSLRDISPYVKTVDVNRAKTGNDVTTKGATGVTYRGGLTDGELRVTGLWDNTASVGTRTVFTVLMQAAVVAPTAFEWYPMGGSTVKLTGNMLVTQYDESSPIDDYVAFTATLKISGAVTDAG